MGAESGRALGCGGEGWRTGWWEGGLCERFCSSLAVVTDL